MFCTSQYDAEENVLTFVAAKPIKKGRPLTLSYGNMSNDAFLLSYGFVPTKNSFDSTPLYASLSDLVRQFANRSAPAAGAGAAGQGTGKGLDVRWLEMVARRAVEHAEEEWRAVADTEDFEEAAWKLRSRGPGEREGLQAWGGSFLDHRLVAALAALHWTAASAAAGGAPGPSASPAHSTGQHSAGQCSTIQCSTVQCRGCTRSVCPACQSFPPPSLPYLEHSQSYSTARDSILQGSAAQYGAFQECPVL